MNREEIFGLGEGEAFIRRHGEWWQQPLIVALSGEMGAGKTQITKWILDSLGHSMTTSPTFSIHNQYRIQNRRVDHFDLYRLQKDDELDSAGFWEALEDHANLVIVEWADRLPEDVFPQSRPKLFMHIEAPADLKRIYVWRMIPV